MTQDEINQGEWSNPENWSLFTYSSTKDTRIFVPKRFGFGWTLNFGRRGAKIWFAAFLSIPLLTFAILWLVGFHPGRK
jgi:uncharacterized membrane protein